MATANRYEFLFGPDLLFLPVADFGGPDAVRLIAKFDGASDLANTTLNALVGSAPHSRLQIERMRRRRSMHIGANLRGAFGEVLVEVHLANQGQTAGLSTVQRTPGTLTTESWDLIWTRDEYGDLAIGEVNCETGRATQRYNYAGETPFLCAEPTDLEIAAIGNLGLRAAQHFGDLAAAITDAGDALQVSGFRLQIPFTPRRSVSPAIVTPIM